MRNFIYFFALIFALLIQHNILYSQDIEAKIDGNTNAKGFSVLDKDLNKLFRVTGSGFVGIGESDPSYKLHINNGSAYVNGQADWFPGLIINNASGRSLILLNGTTSDQNYAGSEIIFNHLNTGKNWGILHSAENKFSFYSYSNGTYTHPLTIESPAADNSIYINALGNVGIGTNDTKGYKFAVAGNVIAEEIVVKLQENWPDFVFEKSYPLMPLKDLENFISEHKHLPDIPSAAETEMSGINVGKVQAKLLGKIEELTLYIIDQNKRLEELEKKYNDLIRKNGTGNE